MESKKASRPPPDLIAALDKVLAGSKTLVSWSLAVVGFTVATIISSSYASPPAGIARLMYLLYLPGWFYLGLSIYHGDVISRRFMAAHFVAEEKIGGIASEVNSDFTAQRNAFTRALGVFALWLLMFLSWWVFGEVDLACLTGKGES